MPQRERDAPLPGGEPSRPQPPRRRLNVVQVFTLLSFLCISVGALTLGFVMSYACRAGFESLERSMTGAYVRQQFHEHFNDDLFKDPRALRDPKTRQALERSMSFADVFRIKVYGPSGEILWSDEDALIDRTFSNNELLRQALNGDIVSKIEETERSEHLYERHQKIVQEVYVPIYSPRNGFLLGVIEVYRIPKVYLEAVRRGVLLSWLVAVGGGVCLYVVLLAVVRGAYQKEKRLESELQAHSLELLREAEKLNTIVGAIGAGLCVLDTDSRITWLNSVMEDWFGAADGILGRKTSEAFGEAGAGACWTFPEAGSKDAVPRQCSSTLPSGEQRWFEVTPTPIRDADGRIAQVLVLVVDVTERKAMDMRLVQAGKMAALGELAGSVVHEINNPIGVISLQVTNLLGILGPDVDESRIRAALEEIRRHVERISLTASELLSFSRQSSDKRQRFDLRDTVREAMHLVEHRCADARVRFDATLDTPCVIDGDYNGLQQVFVNLLNNAVDAMPRGGRVKVEAATRTRERLRVGEEVAVVAIEDSGIGMAPHVRDRIFDFFFTTKEKGHGTGLGLPISRRIVTEHDGEITVSSDAGRGSHFEVVLPLARRTAAATVRPGAGA